MGRYVPKTYNNRRVLRLIAGSIITVVLAAVVVFISLFFGLRTYEVRDPDGTIRLEIPWLMDEPPERDENARSPFVGFILGAAAGIVQFWLVSTLYKKTTRESLDRTAAIVVISQLLIPLIVLLTAVILLRGSLLWAAIGITASLIVCAISRVVSARQKK